MPGRSELRPSRCVAAGARRPGGTSRRHTRQLGLRGLWVVAVALVTIVLLPQSGALADVADGKATYEQLCQACHQAGATGLPGVFPPLAGNPSIEDVEYFVQVVTEGLQGEIVVLGQTYNGNMPAFPQLSEDDIDHLVEYLQSLGSAVGPDASTTTTAAPSAPTAGDPAAGEALFMGSVSLANGGPACYACHSAGPYGGASFGPDLSGATAHLGGVPGLTGWLAAPPSATMQPLFANRPLTETEIADLAVFIDSTAGTRPDRGPDWMLLGGAAVLIALFGVMVFLFKRPRETYVDRLRSRA